MSSLAYLWELAKDDTKNIKQLKATSSSSINLLVPTTSFPAPVYEDGSTEKTVLIRGDKIMAGLMADSYFPNSSNCFYRLTNLSFYQIPAYSYNLTKVQEMTVGHESDQTIMFSAYYSYSVYTTLLI